MSREHGGHADEPLDCANTPLSDQDFFSRVWPKSKSKNQKMMVDENISKRDVF